MAKEKVHHVSVDNGLWFRLAHNRAVELGMATAVGAAALAILDHAGHWANRKLHEERTFKRYRDLIEYLESEESSNERAIVRRTAALGIVHYKGVDVQTMKSRLHPENSSRRTRVGDALLQLTAAGAMERVTPENNRVDMVRPTTAFIQAVTADIRRCPRLVGEVYTFNPEFDFAELRASLPEELRPETLPEPGNQQK